ncbi:hypothetical protein [Methylobacterium sp. E-066]|uniref:hypothetical protein n=1 Tax=Methylobacterium sp. E-066 TaxID=2836584 RepID=UPI001FBA4A05|nr:hypothetical protein [Methylobacterium sp. E-066]MCJ2140271.1 hypothetical protein [Methylobacterium sp. E-066]
MKTTHFNLTAQVPAVPSGTISPPTQSFTVRSLDAYAISNAFVQVNGINNLVDGINSQIAGDTLTCNDFKLQQPDNVVLQIYYHGIRDYSALFPTVKSTEPARAIRMGAFYQEAENCFEQGAWISFMLMSAAIFEHLLYYKLGSPNNPTALSALNTRALNQGAITQNAHNIIKTTNNARNVIHCNRMADPDITRAQAMDAKTVIDELMRAF